MSSPQPGRSPGPVPPQVPAAGTLQTAGVTVPMPPAMRRYGLALLSTVVAFFVRWLLNPALEEGAGVFLPFICAIVISSWYGGLGPGLLATGLGACLACYAFLPPPWSWTLQGLTGLVYVVLFLVTGAAISVLQAQLHRARRRAEAEAAERKVAEEAQREHARFIHQITELSPVILDVFDLVTGRHTYFSSDTLTLYGYTREEMVQMEDKFAVMVYPDDIPRLSANIARLQRLADGEIYEFECRVRRRDGEWRWIAARSMVFARTEQGEVQQTVNAAFDVTERKHAEDALRRAHDELEQRVMERTSQLTAINAELIREITERQRAEEALQRSEAYLAEGQRLTHTGSGSWNVVTGEVFWSQETYRIYGVDPGQTQPSYDVFFGIVHPEGRLFLEQAFARVVRDRSDYELEFRIIHPDGRVRHIHSVGHPVFDEAGHVTEVVGTVVDVTERKRAEEALQKAQAELAHVTRVMTMGELVAAIAHEVNQPLGAIVTNGQACLRLLAREAPNLDQVRDVIERVIHDGLRASDVIMRIRALLKKNDAEQAPLNLNAIIQDVLAVMSAEVSQHESLCRRPSPPISRRCWETGCKCSK